MPQPAEVYIYNWEEKRKKNLLQAYDLYNHVINQKRQARPPGPVKTGAPIVKSLY